MKLYVQSEYTGVEVEGAKDSGQHEWHTLWEAETGSQAVERQFASAVEATLYLAAMRPELEARGLPAMDADDEDFMIAECGKTVDRLEKADAGEQMFTGNVPRLILRWLKQPHSDRAEAAIGDKLKRLAELVERHEQAQPKEK